MTFCVHPVSGLQETRRIHPHPVTDDDYCCWPVEVVVWPRIPHCRYAGRQWRHGWRTYTTFLSNTCALTIIILHINMQPFNDTGHIFFLIVNNCILFLPKLLSIMQQTVTSRLTYEYTTSPSTTYRSTTIIKQTDLHFTSYSPASKWNKSCFFLIIE